jgi:hypothetical protein
MTGKLPLDRFDEIRREWIATHQGWSTMQRRRAEQLGRIVRRRQRIRTSAVPDPHDDTVLDPLWIRSAKSPASQLELVLVAVTAAIAPLGWPGGWVLHRFITGLIPQTLRGFPVAALVWSGAALGLVTVLSYQLVDDVAGSPGYIAVLLWLCQQLSVIPAVAGIYGIANGWLALEGSRPWWPLTPVNPRLTAEDAAAILSGYDMTGPAVIDARPLGEPGPRTRQ